MENKKNSNEPARTPGITQILNEILDASIIETLPSTSRSASRPHTTASNIPQEGMVTPHSSISCSDDTSVSGIPSVHCTSSSTEETSNVIEGPAFETCTVKEILTEILDCTVIRKPSILQQSSQRTEKNVAKPTVPEFVLDPKLIPRQVFNVRCNSDESTCSRMQYTVKEVLTEILEYNNLKKSIQPGSGRPLPVNDSTGRAGTSHPKPEYRSQGELGSNQWDYQIYRAAVGGGTKSTSALESSSVKSLNNILPSYSTVLKLGPPPKMSFHSSGSFIPKQPPPSYSEVEGLWEDNPSMISSESVIFGPDPTYIVCPRCRAVVVTDIQTERSRLTHLIALVMCLCLCWPCCLLPYCLRSCNYTYHSCPNCRHYFGMYRPF